MEAWGRGLAERLKAEPGLGAGVTVRGLARRLVAPYREGLAVLDPRARRLVGAGVLFVAARMSVMTFIGVYMHEQKGVALALVGLAFLVENLCRGLVAPFAGALSDRVGRRPVLLGSAFSMVLLMPLFLLVQDAATLFAWSVLLGLAQGPYFPAAGALLLDTVPPERRQEVLAVNYTGISLGYALGVAPAGFLAQTSFVALAFASSATFLLIGLLLAFGLRGRMPQPPPASRGVAANAVLAARDPAFLAFAAPCVLFPLGIGLVSLVLPLYATEAGLPKGLVGVLLGSTGLLLMALSIPLNQGVRTPFRLLPLAGALCASSYLAFALAPTPLGFLVGLALFTVGETLFSAAIPTAVAALAPPGSRGAYQGAWGFLMSVGVGAALLLSGVLREHVGWRGAWLVFVAAGLASAAALLAGRAWFRRTADARAARAWDAAEEGRGGASL